MLHTSVARYEPHVPRASGGSPGVHQSAAPQVAVRRERRQEDAVDEALADSFPASDPPAWNPGVARPVPVDGARNWGAVERTTDRNRASTDAPGVIDVSRGHASERTFAQMLVSLAGAVGLALLVPVVILLAGLPFVLAVRGLLEVLHWVSAAFR